MFLRIKCKKNGKLVASKSPVIGHIQSRKEGNVITNIFSKILYVQRSIAISFKEILSGLVKLKKFNFKKKNSVKYSTN